MNKVPLMVCAVVLLLASQCPSKKKVSKASGNEDLAANVVTDLSSQEGGDHPKVDTDEVVVNPDDNNPGKEKLVEGTEKVLPEGREDNGGQENKSSPLGTLERLVITGKKYEDIKKEVMIGLNDAFKKAPDNKPWGRKRPQTINKKSITHVVSQLKPTGKLKEVLDLAAKNSRWQKFLSSSDENGPTMHFIIEAITACYVIEQANRENKITKEFLDEVAQRLTILKEGKGVFYRVNKKENTMLDCRVPGTDLGWRKKLRPIVAKMQKAVRAYPTNS